MLEEEMGPAIERGVAVFDYAYGPSWPLTIDIAQLEMDSCTECMAGQVAGGTYKTYVDPFSGTTREIHDFHSFMAWADAEWEQLADEGLVAEVRPEYSGAHLGLDIDGRDFPEHVTYTMLAEAWAAKVLALVAERTNG